MKSKHLLLCATDAGGSQYLRSLINLIQLKGLRCVLIISKPSLLGIDERQNFIEQPDILSLGDAVEYLISKPPRAVICGTTRFLSPDRLLTAAAKKLGIKTIAILDEWFNYRMRFEDEKGELAYLPDVICCQDERVRQEAIAEGVPPDLLLVTGSLSLENLESSAEKFLLNPPAQPSFMINKNKPVVTFLSELFATNYGTKPGERGRLGEFVGYTEHTVRRDLFDSLSMVQVPCTVVEKLHATTVDDYEPLTNEFIEWIVVRDIQLWPLLWHSDLVVGMRSMALAEAALLGCKVISYQPSLLGAQLCTAVRLKLVKDIYDRQDFDLWITKNIYGGLHSSGRVLKKANFARKDVAENILNLALR